MIRIIPRIDVKNDWLVKGVHLEGLRAIGEPAEFARRYYEEGADEIIFMDVVASLYQRNTLLDLVSNVASNVYIPLTVGGGLRSVDDIAKVLAAGADKVAINTAAINNPDLISEAANRFGSSTLVIAVEVIRQPDGSYHCYNDNGREPTGREAVSWVKQAQELGAGEIMLTSVDREGTGEGFDMDIIAAVSDAARIPVIAHGGAGNVDHVVQLCQSNHDIRAICMASMLHYRMARELGQNQPVNATYSNAGMKRARIQDITLTELKQKLAAQGVSVRHA